jgi:hypothetical protein
MPQVGCLLAELRQPVLGCTDAAYRQNAGIILAGFTLAVTLQGSTGISS